MVSLIDEFAGPSLAVARAEKIFSQGDLCTGAYLLLAGRVQLTMHGARGRVVLRKEVSPGDLFGLSAAVSNRPFSMTALATEPSEVRFVSREMLLEIMSQRAVVAVAVLALLAEDVRSAREAVLNSSVTDTSLDQLFSWIN